MGKKPAKGSKRLALLGQLKRVEWFCGVIAPEDGEKLFEAMRSTDESISEELRLLMIAHRDATDTKFKNPNP